MTYLIQFHPIECINYKVFVSFISKAYPMALHEIPFTTTESHFVLLYLFLDYINDKFQPTNQPAGLSFRCEKLY